MPGENGNNNKKKTNFLVIYAVSLLTIALVLLLLSYFQQQRASEQIGSLEKKHDVFSTSALQSIDEMRNSLSELEAKNQELEASLEDAQSENRKLEEKNGELENKVSSLEDDSSALRERIAGLEKTAEENKALSADLWRVVSLVSGKEYAEAADLAAQRHAGFAEAFSESAEGSPEAEFYAAYLSALDRLESRGAVELERDENGTVINVSIPQEG